MSIEKCTVSLATPGNGRQQLAGLHQQIEELLLGLDGTASIGSIEATIGSSCPRAQLLLELLHMQDSGLLEIKFPCYSEEIRELYMCIGSPAAACARNPSLWNIVGFENMLREKRPSPDASDEYLALKEIERDVYLSLVEPFLEELPSRSRALDAGCGTGRFSAPLASRGFSVFLLDACLSCLKAALRRLLEAGYENFDIFWADVCNLDIFAQQSFDLVLAIETLCYCTNPSRALAELVRVTKKGGIIALSVEAPFGAVGGDCSVGIGGAQRILDKGILTVPLQAHTRYFTRSEFRRLLEDAGLAVLLLEGTHYFLEGVFMRQIENILPEIEAHRTQIMRLEERCRRIEHLSEMARAWLAVVRVE